jgi:hypothetical protein
VASRLPPLWRLARLACAALSVAASISAGAGRAQQAQGDLNLRGELSADFSGDDGPEPPGDGSPTEPEVQPAQNALPPLKPYKGAQRLDRQGGPKGVAGELAPPPTIAALPTPPKPPRKKPDDKPFDPVGVEVGDLRLTPSVEEDLGWSSNPGLLPGPQKGSAFTTTTAEVGLDSDWSTSAVHGDLKGGYTDYFTDHSADAPFANGVLDGRYDASRDSSLDGELRLALTTMTAGSLGLGPNVAFGPTGMPLTAIYGGTIGGDQKFGRFDLSLHGSLDRTTYENTTFSNGQVDDLSSDDFNDWALRARAAYADSPEFKPFLDVKVDERRYDLGEDENGYERNSDGVEARAGADVEFTRLLTGSLDFGYGDRNYQDPRLPNLASPLIDAALIWTATPLTTVTLKTATSLSETTIPGASGAAQHATTLEVDHALRRYFTLTGTVGYLTDAYAGLPLRDATTTFGLAASYSLNRDIVLKASASRQFYSSNEPGTNYTATVVMLGLKLQR